MFLDEIAEDLEGLVNMLKGFRVKEHRPTIHNLSHITFPILGLHEHNVYNTRDLDLVVANTVSKIRLISAVAAMKPQPCTQSGTNTSRWGSDG